MKTSIIQSVGNFIIILISFAFIFGCSSLPPLQPIRDFASISGKWTGVLGGPMLTAQFVTLIIYEDGTAEMIMPHEFPEVGGGYSGKGVLSEGKYQFKNGEYTLHEGNGRRVLFYRMYTGKGLDTIELEPAKD